MKILKILTTIILLSVVCVSAEVPKLINYSGKLTDKTDHIVADGTYDMRFGLWDAATNGNKIWEENHYVADGKGVPVARGSFSTFVGSVNPAGNPMPNFDKNYYMEFSFKKNAASPWEVFPRQQIISVAYAMRAEEANNAKTAGAAANSYKLEGIGASGFIMKNIHAVTNGDLASGAVDQDKARFAPVVWPHGSMTNDYPRIIYGKAVTNSGGTIHIDLSMYLFLSAPNVTLGVICSPPNVICATVYNVTKDGCDIATYLTNGTVWGNCEVYYCIVK